MALEHPVLKQELLPKVSPGHVTKPEYGLIVAGLLIALAAVFYIPSIGHTTYYKDAIRYFLAFLLPTASVHILLLSLMVVLFGLKARGCLVYWGISTFALLAKGGWGRMAAFIIALAFAIVLWAWGKALGRRILPEKESKFGSSLALGILACSYLGALLCWVHLYTWWMLALVAGVGLWLTASEFRMAWARLPEQWHALNSHWSLATTVSLEGLFLVAVFLFVAATAPEMKSDALRFYWPYLKMLKANSGFFSIPYQWYYTIPQSGLSYAGVLYLLLGGVSVRWAMMLAWVALIGMVASHNSDRLHPAALALALVIAACPMVLLVTGTLMQDAFVCLAVLALATVCLQGDTSHPGTFWVAVGGLTGVAWTAKYSTLPYAVPLALFALVRSWHARSLRFRAVILAPLACLAGAAPWIWHTWRESGDPVFPFFLKLFPARLWPNGVGMGDLEMFRLPPGWKSWLLWPISMTYETHRFVEWGNGSLGLAIPIVLIIALLAVRSLSWTSRACLTAGILGTWLLCKQTAYARYWLPGLWLAAMAASEGIRILSRSRVGLLVASFVALVITGFQIPVAMINAYVDPNGWPWDFYVRRLNESQYIARHYPGFPLLAGRQEFKLDRPRVWFTDYQATGHLRVCPLEATLWETALHGAILPREKLLYLGSTSCRFWIVNEDGQDAFWWRRLGIAPFYWDDSYLLASEGPVALYRMPPVEEVLAAFDQRAAVGTDLVWDPGFETGRNGKSRYWWFFENSQWVRDPELAQTGSGCAYIGPRGVIRQDIPLPPGLKRVELVENVRSAAKPNMSSVGFQIYFQGSREQFLGSKDKIGEVTLQWQEQRMALDAPSGAVFAIIFLRNQSTSGAAYFDNIHLYSRD